LILRNFSAELKRRNVYKVVIAYGAAQSGRDNFMALQPCNPAALKLGSRDSFMHYCIPAPLQQIPKVPCDRG